MKKQFLFILLFLLNPSLYSQKPMFSEPLSSRIANYKIDVTLDDKNKMLLANEILTWKNDSQDQINELQFHLYLNAFKNEATTFMKESKGWHRRSSADRKDGWGWININKMELMSGEYLTTKIEFIQPDDNNLSDQTVIRVLLKEYIMPQQTVKIKIEFEAKLPKVFARTGYYQDFFLIGQWFPKIGVYEEAGERYATEGQWNCHQFHSDSEFFSDFGVYDVTITVPQKYVVGATGVLVDEQINEDSTKSLNYYCEDVHDFAWTADPNYVVIEDQWEHVKIKYLVQQHRTFAADRFIQAIKNSLEYFEEWYGEYPYPVFTAVDPRYGAGGAGGMEYPTFVTTGFGMLSHLTEGYKYPEMVTIHEFGHNYWYGLVANNEFEEAWLDEGFTTYSELMVSKKYYNSGGGSYLDLFGIKVSNTQSTRFWYSNFSPKRNKIFNCSWKYEAGGYYAYSYNKPALMLMTLHNYLGDTKMKKVMRAYFRRFKFKHPTTLDFIKTANEISGENLNWFFDQLIYGNGVLDYKIHRITNEQIEVADRGYFDTDSTMTLIGTKELDDALKDSTHIQLFQSEVIVLREGEVTFPVEVLVKFNNGDELLEKWDGKSPNKVFKYQKAAKVISAEVDPNSKVLLDVNPLNNGKIIKAQKTPVRKYSAKWLFWMQNLLHFISTFS